MQMSPNATILVVEDNLAMNTAICEILELHDYKVYSASNGKEALTLLQEMRPDVVLCDIMMPQMDGYTLLRHTRAVEHLRTLPFIFLTARSSLEDKREAKNIGIEDYLVKPVEPEDLTIAVENALRRTRYLAQETQAQMDQLRGQIVRTLQHEFRTPLTFILGYAEYLADESTQKIDLNTLRLSTKAILEGGRRLQDLIEKFLLLADIQLRQQLPGNIEHMSAYYLLQDAANALAQEAQNASLEVSVSGMELGLVLVGEVKYLHSALTHLLENSIVYKRAESKRIWLAVRESDGYVGLEVKDEGRGIPQEELAKLRRPFEQANRTDRTMPGAGLSLALVHHIARLHGGSLEIQSQEGKGSTFTLWLPKPIQAEA